MWPEAVASNEASWAASDAWVRERKLPASERDYHSLHWLLYAYLQQGRHGLAEDQLQIMRRSLAQFPKDDARNRAFGTYSAASMAAAYLIETERWDEAETILKPASPHSGASDEAAGGPYQIYARIAQSPATFARGLAAAIKGQDGGAERAIAELGAIGEQMAGKPLPFETRMDKVIGIQKTEIAAALSLAKGDTKAAIEQIGAATAVVETLPPPSGPPPSIKPPHELFGEILLRAGRAEEAVKQFAISLHRHPDRARSLLGKARALHASGNPQATAEVYARLAAHWTGSDAGVPELEEVRGRAKEARGR
jgi:hypothetical protein